MYCQARWLYGAVFGYALTSCLIPCAESVAVCHVALLRCRTLQNGVSLGALVGVILNLVMPTSTPEELAAVRSIGDTIRDAVLPTTSAPSGTVPMLAATKSESMSSTPEGSSSENDASAPPTAAPGCHRPPLTNHSGTYA